MYETSIAVSPNGRFIAYAALPSNESVSYLYVREMDSVAPIQLLGTEGAAFPFWSPDSGYVGFSAGGYLKIIDITGGAREIYAQLVVFQVE